MERFKGTKGSWAIKKSESKNAINIVGTTLGGKWKIARLPIIECGDVFLDVREEQEVKANAQLIATAPELLEVLQDLLKFCKSHNMDNFYTGSAEGVIDKALGI